MNFTVGRFGKLDCVVNNAGASGEGGPIAEISVDGFDRTIALLLRGSFLGIKYAVPHMQSGGTIINIASVAGLTGGWGPHPYSAAKFGVVGLTKSAALELAERGIRVNAICPGGIATAIFAAAVPDLPAELLECTPEIVAPWIAGRYPNGRSGFPADIANAALWLASSESSFVTGHALVVDGGLTAGPPWSQQNQSYELSKRALPVGHGPDYAAIRGCFRERRLKAEETMKAAVVHSFDKPLVIEEVPKPVPGSGEIVVKLETSGLCHSDIHASRGDWPVKPKLPLIPGHEGIGIVVEVGKDVTEVKEGDRVAVPVLGYACGSCEYCISGWPHPRISLRFLALAA
jgi:NADP-dependent 3-hydroxy acid dehydrogenase YdfG